MFRRITVFLLVCNCAVFSMANTTPLTIAELSASRATAEADLAKAQGEQDLANWLLSQLETLYKRGHASWHEVAEQQVAAKKAAANTRGAQQYLDTVLQWQAKLAGSSVKLPLVDTEAIRLYLPGSSRLVAWVPAEQASHALLSRQIEALTAEHAVLSNIDSSSLESAIETAERAVDVYSESPSSTHRLQRAEIRLRIAKANNELVRAQAENAAIIARRIAVLRTKLSNSESTPSSLARVGTTFVDSSDNRELAQLVGTMAAEEAAAVDHVTWLKQHRATMLARIQKLGKLSHYSTADPVELDYARSQKTVIDELIQESTTLLEMHQRIASNYETLSSEAGAHSQYLESTAFENQLIVDATFVRHMLQLRDRKSQTEVDRAAIEAERDYLAERFTRLESIQHSARQPHELEHLRERIQATERLAELIDGRLAQLGHESERFLRQFKSQRGDEYQLVQVTDGKFISRGELAAGEALIASLGFVGVMPKSAAPHAYLESTAILDCVTTLNSQEQPSGVEIVGLKVTGPNDQSLHLGTRPSVWKATVGGLRLASYGTSYSNALSCYAPYDLWQLYSQCPVSPGDYLRSVSAFRSRIPRYSAEYAFGIRRHGSASSSRYRRRASTYGGSYGPWYLPGSPTNYRD